MHSAVSSYNRVGSSSFHSCLSRRTMDSSAAADLLAKLRGVRVAIGEECVLDVEEHRLWLQGNLVPLPPKAFLTLAVLVARAGHLVEKADLLDAVWGEAHVEEGGLARTVSLLRKALGDDPVHHRFIETVATHGYRFIAPVRTLDSGPSPPPAG